MHYLKMNKFIKNNFIKFLAIPLFLYSSVSQAIVASPNPIPGSEIGVAYLKPNDNKIYGQNVDTDRKSVV